MSQLPTVEARKAMVGSLLCGPTATCCGGGVGAQLNCCCCSYYCWNCRGWNYGRLPQLTPRWGIHHAVLGRSTARTTTASGCRHYPLSLFLIGLSNDLHHPLLVDGCTCQLIVRQAREMHHALLQMDGEPYTVQVGLLFICVDVV
jgi:hypothetical protein